DVADTYKVTLKTTGVAGEDLSLSLIKDANNNGVIDSGDVLVKSDALNSPFETVVSTVGAGRYFVRVAGVNGATNYTLTSSFVGMDGDDTIPEVQNLPSHTVALGHFVDLGLGTRDDVDLFKFTVAAGQRVGFDLDSRNGSNLDTFLRVFRSDG